MSGEQRTTFLSIGLAAAAACAACGDNLTVLPEREAYQAPEVAPLPCVPNLDGRIDPRELQAAVGIPEHFLVSPAGVTRPVDLEGEAGSAGLVFDWSIDYADDQVSEVRASGMADKWYRSSFPTAQFTAPFDLGGTIDSIYQKDDSALYLVGLASAESDPAEGRTLLVYGEPVAVYRFPIQKGADYVSVGTVQNGTLRGLPYAGRDTYHVEVDAVGELRLPDVTFTQALRVRTAVLVEPAVGISVSRRQVSFLFECFGEVARATSRDGELETNFRTAVDVRRLGF